MSGFMLPLPAPCPYCLSPFSGVGVPLQPHSLNVDAPSLPRGTAGQWGALEGSWRWSKCALGRWLLIQLCISSPEGAEGNCPDVERDMPLPVRALSPGQSVSSKQPCDSARLLLWPHRRGRNSFPLACHFIYFLSTLTSAKRVLSEIIYWALTLVFAGLKIPVISHTHTHTPTPNLVHSRGLRRGIVCAFSLDHKPLPLAWSVFCLVWVFPPRTPILHLHPLKPPDLVREAGAAGGGPSLVFAHQPPHGWLGALGLPKRSSAPVLAEVPQEQHVPLSFTWTRPSLRPLPSISITFL